MANVHFPNTEEEAQAVLDQMSDDERAFVEQDFVVAEDAPSEGAFNAVTYAKMSKLISYRQMKLIDSSGRKNYLR
jgi:hypothetical protein